MSQVKSKPQLSRGRQPRMGEARPLLRGVSKSVVGVLVMGACVQGFLWLFQKGGWEVPSFLRPHTYFQLQDIWVEGRERTSLLALQRALHCKRGDPLWDVSPLLLKQRLEKLPWVKTVIVQRHMLGSVSIHLIERQPLALWQKAGHKKLLDTEGHIIACQEEEYPAHLITVVGEEAPQATGALLKMLEALPPFFQRIQAAVRLRSGRWDLYLKEKTILKLPARQETQALQRFLAFEKQAPEIVRVEIADLRFPDRLILRASSHAKEMQKI